MYSEGTIIYFTPFYFKNGNTAKNKYFLVLKNIDNKLLLATLPSSQKFLPNSLSENEGCIKELDINISCFAISKTMKVTECGKQFPCKTYLYATNVDEYEVNTMQDIYKKADKDYCIWGKMNAELFALIQDCFKNSELVKRKFKRRL
ncbi:MAG: hypothetical protein ACRC3G_07425 [Bacteroidales bacterium]